MNMVACLLAVATACSVTLPVATAHASSTFLTQRTKDYGTLSNETSYLSDEVVLDAVNHIQDYWALEYPNHTMVAKHSRFYSERLTAPSGAETRWVYRVYVMMDGYSTLRTHPDSHPYVQGMRVGLSGMTPEEYTIAEPHVNQYVQTLEAAYGKEKDFTATYTLLYYFDYDPSEWWHDEPQPLYYAQFSQQTEKTLLPDLYSYPLEVTRYARQMQEAEAAIWQYVWGVQGLGAPTRDVSYHIPSAVEYAYTHGWDVPQYSSANGLGSDCANFVSRCLMAGGISADYAGNWYPSSSWGSYGSNNWIRTGYTASMGGVIIYMRNRNLLYKQSNRVNVTAGSVLFYHDTSHVGFLTYSDGEVMTYADHSNSSKECRDYLWESRCADYYSPSPYIVVW